MAKSDEVSADKDHAVEPQIIEPGSVQVSQEETALPKTARAFKDSELPQFQPPSVAGEIGRFGKYRIQKEVGCGGMGAVYLAFDERLQRKVALKVMLPKAAANTSAKERFLREARAAAQINSDHVVTIHEADEIDGRPYIALQFLQGCPLDEFLEKNGSPSLPQIIRIARETAIGLTAAHELGLVHRDIKPGNLWLESPAGRVKILDFGLAKPVAGEGGVELTRTGAVMGTPAYMAPEQAMAKPLDGRADLFSLGCVLYRLSAGKLPFDKPNLLAMLTALAIEEPPSVQELNPAVPEALASLICRLMAKNPADRPASARVVAKELEEVLKKMKPATQISTITQPPAIIAPKLASNPFADMEESGGERTSLTSPTPQIRKFSAVLVGALFIGFLTLMTAGVIIVKVTNKDGTVTELRVDDKAKIEVNGKTITVESKFKAEDKATADLKDKSATSEPKKADPNAAIVPERKAAEYAISIGGTVRVNGQDRDINILADLPRGFFRLTSVVLRQNKRVDDAGLANFKESKSLLTLDLWEAKVTDAGLANFKDCKNLQDLQLGGTLVTDAGLKHFKDCTELRFLILSDTQVTDAGLANFKDCISLDNLDVSQTGVTDAGLAHFDGCKNLTSLWLNGSQVTDAGLACFKNCKNLTSLNLQNSQVTDSGLAHFNGLGNLKRLWLSDTRVGDAGLASFKNCKGLTSLLLSNTQVSDKGLEHFAGCENLQFLYLDRTAIGDKGLAHFNGFKKLTGIGLWNTQVSDAGLAHLKESKNFTDIGLQGTKITDQGLSCFSDCKGLTNLVLARTQVTDAGLAHFKDCDNLMGLYIWNTSISDAGLVCFKNCKNLTGLWLNGTRVTNAGLAHFQECLNLRDLNLENLPIGDAGLANFAKCKALISLNLRQTQVTSGTIAELRQSLPNCKIEWDEVENEAKTNTGNDRKAAEYVLSIGGVVRFDGEAKDIKAVSELPRSGIHLTSVTLRQNKQLNDIGLVNFKGCKNLSHLDLWEANVTDVGLANFKDCKKLTGLQLQGTKVTDAGLAHFKGCNNLTFLVLGDGGGKVTDKGLAVFAECKNLQLLSLQNIRITDSGLSQFKGYATITNLWLNGTKVTDKGLAHFKDCKGLSDLNLQNTDVTDAGMVFLKGFSDLKVLRLDNTRVGDMGLANIKDCKGLTQIYLRKSKVTQHKINELKKTLPICLIDWDGGLIQTQP